MRNILKAYIITILLALPLFAQAQNAKRPPPTFAEYRVAHTKATQKVPLKLKKEDMFFKTRLRLGYAEPINFAGKYVITTWGCGAECLMGAAIDTETGLVHPLPGSVCCWFDGTENTSNDEPIEFTTESSLIILRGVINESGRRATHYYHISNDGTFKPITYGK